VGEVLPQRVALDTNSFLREDGCDRSLLRFGNDGNASSYTGADRCDPRILRFHTRPDGGKNLSGYEGRTVVVSERSGRERSRKELMNSSSRTRHVRYERIGQPVGVRTRYRTSETRIGIPRSERRTYCFVPFLLPPPFGCMFGCFVPLLGSKVLARCRYAGEGEATIGERLDSERRNVLRRRIWEHTLRPRNGTGKEKRNDGCRTRKPYEARYRRNTNEKHPEKAPKEIEVPTDSLTESLRAPFRSKPRDKRETNSPERKRRL